MLNLIFVPFDSYICYMYIVGWFFTGFATPVRNRRTDGTGRTDGEAFPKLSGRSGRAEAPLPKTNNNDHCYDHYQYFLHQYVFELYAYNEAI